MRIFLDSTVATHISKNQIEDIIAAGNQIVVSNTAIDIKLFQENQHWFSKLVIDQNIIIEMWNTFDEMTSKSFYWSSLQITSPACQSFEEVIRFLPNYHQILDLSYMINMYALQKGHWIEGKPFEPIILTKVEENFLGIDSSTATRTQMLLAAKRKNHMASYYKYNLEYCIRLARQHMCDAVLNDDGRITIIPR